MLQLEQLPEYFCHTQSFDAFLKIGFEEYWQITRDRVAVLAQLPPSSLQPSWTARGSILLYSRAVLVLGSPKLTNNCFGSLESPCGSNLS